MEQIVLHKAQSEIFSDLFVNKTTRYAVGVCTRGFGKSYLAAICAIQAVTELLELPESVPNKNVTLLAPTYQQAVDIYFPLLWYEFGMKDYASTGSAYSGKIRFENGTELRLMSYESAERLRGTGQYFIVCDEVSSWQQKPGLEETWKATLKPCITTRWSRDQAKKFGAPSPGRALIISTPMGYNYLHDMFNMEHVDEDWKGYHFTYRDAPHLSHTEIEKEKLLSDPLRFAREYEASFEDSGANVFYNFRRTEHIAEDIPYFADEEDVHVSIDFNVGVMAWSAFAKRGDQIHFITDGKGAPDTTQLAKMLKSRFHGHRIYAYPDPSGRARKTSAAAGITDFKILESEGITCRARRKAPPIADSVQAVNLMLKNAAGQVRMYFRPDCQNTIKSMETTVWKEGSIDSAQIDKAMGAEHHSDGVRYATEYLFPVQAGGKKVIRSTMTF